MKTDNLFALINSLTKSEKRYFKLVSSLQSSNLEKDYILLFDHIEALENYDEAEVKAHFDGHTLLSHFATTKRYLIKKILKSLRELNSNSSKKDELVEAISNVAILKEKGLNKMFLKEIKKSKEIALEYELFAEFISLCNIEIAYWGGKYFDKLDITQVDDLNAQLNHAAAQLENVIQYRAFATVLRFFVMRHSGVSDRLEEMMAHPMLNDASKAISIRAKIFFHETKAIFGHISGNLEEAQNNHFQSIKLLRANKSLLQEEFNMYISIYNNYITSFVAQHKMKTALEELQLFSKHLEDIKVNSTRRSYFNHRKFDMMYSIKLHIFFLQRRFDDMIKLIEPISNGLKRYQNYVTYSKYIFYSYLFAQAYFCTNRTEEAHQWISKVIDHKELETRPLYHSAGLMLKLMIHYDLGNYKYLHYEIKKVRYALRKNGLYNDLEKNVISLIQKLAGKKKGKPSLEILDELYALTRGHEEKNSVNSDVLFKVSDWVQLKIDEAKA